MIDRDLCGVHPQSILAKFDAGLDTAAIHDWYARSRVRRGRWYPTEAAISAALSRALAERRRMAEMYLARHSLAEIGLRHGVTPQRIHQRMAELGICRTSRNPRWSVDEIAALREAWLGKTAAEIGAQLGRPKNGVLGMAHRLGLPSKSLSGGWRRAA